MLRYETIPVTPFEQNCSIVWCDRTMKGAVIDPGGEVERLIAEARRLGVTLEQILLTHAHIDHAGGAQAYLEAYPNVQIIAHSMGLHDHVLVGLDRKVEFLSKGSARSIAAVKKAIADATARLGQSGRLLIRPSGTEPVIRVMAEGDDELLVKDVVSNIVGAIERVAGH